MGHISNQWLGRGEGLRNRSYYPVPVRISCELAKGSWSERNHAKIEFTAYRANGEYHTMYLSEAESANAAEILQKFMSPKAREKLLQAMLRNMSHAKLLRALAVELKVRVRLPKDR